MADDATLLTAPTSTDTGTGEGSAEATGGKPVSAPPTNEPTDSGESNSGDISYELNFPEGVEANEATLNDITTYAKEHGLSNVQAQAQLNREIDLLAKGEEFYTQKHIQILEDSKKQWLEEVKKDPEIGGDKFDVTVSKAKRVIDKFGSDKLKAALNESGLGNHPEVVRLFAKIGDLDKEDTHVGGNGPVASPEEDRAKTLYPND